jgi:nonsense-mediated mRNA decay protein 3
LRGPVYFDTPFNALCEAKDLAEFYIIDVQYENARHGKYVLATVECALATDLSKTFITRTHLGNILKAGDHASGYFLANRNFNSDHFDELVTRIAHSSRSGHLGGGIPDVVLIKKSYPNIRKKNRGRNWRLKNLAKEKEEEEMRGNSKVDKAKAELDYELFLRDLEEDADLRAMVNLYKGMYLSPIYNLS